jgi:hypothetical protein
MKVVLKKEIGLHAAGTVLDVEDSMVMQLEREDVAERYIEEKQDVLDSQNPVEPKRKGNPNWTKKQ